MRLFIYDIKSKAALGDFYGRSIEVIASDEKAARNKALHKCEMRLAALAGVGGFYSWDKKDAVPVLIGEKSI